MAKHIYIVEDDEDIRYIVGYILTDMGCEVKLSETISSFREYMKEGEQPDLILLDVMLPDGNGLDLCLELKKEPETAHIPIIIMSAHATQDYVLKLACAEDFISKPFDLEYFTTVVKKHLAV